MAKEFHNVHCQINEGHEVAGMAIDLSDIRKFTFGTNAEQFHSHATARQDCIDRLPRSFLQALADELRIEKPNDEGKVA